jgi:hypothetical protein
MPEPGFSAIQPDGIREKGKGQIKLVPGNR